MTPTSSAGSPAAARRLGLVGWFLVGAALLLALGAAARAIHHRLAAPVTVRILYTGDDRGFVDPCG
jgi:uncharacterized membrane protein YphA (DoxX/SURF4 family)